MITQHVNHWLIVEPPSPEAPERDRLGGLTLYQAEAPAGERLAGKTGTPDPNPRILLNSCFEQFC